MAGQIGAVPWQRPVRTGFIQLWSDLAAPGKPRLGRGVSSAIGGACRPGPLPAGTHRRQWKQLPGCARTHTVLIRPVTRTCSRTQTHSEPRGTAGLRKGPGAGQWRRSGCRQAFSKGPALSEQQPSAGAGRGSGRSARCWGRGNADPPPPPTENEVTEGPEMTRGKTGGENPKVPNPPQKCLKPQVR